MEGGFEGFCGGIWPAGFAPGRWDSCFFGTFCATSCFFIDISFSCVPAAPPRMWDPFHGLWQTGYAEP